MHTVVKCQAPIFFFLEHYWGYIRGTSRRVVVLAAHCFAAQRQGGVGGVVLIVVRRKRQRHLCLFPPLLLRVVSFSGADAPPSSRFLQFLSVPGESERRIPFRDHRRRAPSPSTYPLCRRRPASPPPPRSFRRLAPVCAFHLREERKYLLFLPFPLPLAVNVGKAGWRGALPTKSPPLPLLYPFSHHCTPERDVEKDASPPPSASHPCIFVLRPSSSV